MTVTTPNGGENWVTGTTHKLTFAATGQRRRHRGGSGSVDQQRRHLTSIATGLTTNSSGIGSFMWLVPNTPSTQCLVRGTARGDAAGNAGADLSNAVFADQRRDRSGRGADVAHRRRVVADLIGPRDHVDRQRQRRRDQRGSRLLEQRRHQLDADRRRARQLRDSFAWTAPAAATHHGAGATHRPMRRPTRRPRAARTSRSSRRSPRRPSCSSSAPIFGQRHRRLPDTGRSVAVEGPAVRLAPRPARAVRRLVDQRLDG